MWGDNDEWPVEGAQVPQAASRWGLGMVLQWWLAVVGRQWRCLGCGDRRWADGVPNSQGRRGPVGGAHWPG